MNKAVLVLVDGMRPDGMLESKNPFVSELLAHSAHSMSARTVMPSVTLPCHMSLFHSVEPSRHGITTNTYIPQVRPIKGLCENLRAHGKTCAFFYNWEELKDLSRPDSLMYANFVSGHIFGYEAANRMVTDASISFIGEYKPDFTFVYMGWTDAAGHDFGWMGPEYLHSVDESLKCVKKIAESLPEDYLLILTADHGGHARSHGSDIPEDMTIPLIMYNPALESTELENASILDIAPTTANLLGSTPDPEWEGQIRKI
ncbi:MAG: alkaline phosphatase family protein [Clostridia bacterium]|nr:alkaline phosphatase family protein [Clostridia bacterium]